MMTSTFAHPYATQVVSLWLSLLPIAGIAALMAAARLRGDRSRTLAKIRARVPVLTDPCL